ncbi:monocarboxylate transporter 12-B-like [Sitodiplosis mosellana]|uniref:monocarboxylate transporter 12-B-like n=1 Tax=Sitodiplosis mosellana TaxID=263140 RepID=UPI002443F09C|nr:monocarboxylate transporter 12-B-like [Sitodiplosis mosellana]
MKLNNSPQLKPDEKTESGHRKQDAQDGGFGWVVVFGSFFINFIAAGTLYSFGIIYTHFLDEFKESKAYTSWILSLLSGLSAVFGPITSFFVISYGCRVVGIAGAVLCAVSFFASAFAKNVFTLIVTIGIFGGFSLSLIFIPPLICVTTYFEKRRALATGIAVSGSGAGTFLIAPLISLLTNEYGWRITLMILSGKMLTCALFAALFRPINSSSQDNSSPEGSDISQRKQSEQFIRSDALIHAGLSVCRYYDLFKRCNTFHNSTITKMCYEKTITTQKSEKMKSNNSLQLECNGNDEQVKNKQNALDGGFGWVVVFASFFIFFISVGIVYSFGIIYTHLLDEFKESKGYTSFVMSLMTGLASLTSPISSLLVQKYGCSATTILGAVLCAISFFVGAFAKNVFTLILTIGISGGFGFGLIFLPPIVIVSTYFEKKRSLATGISLAGSGLGTFVLVPFVNFLSEEYGWRRALMILAGILLICGLLGILYRPLSSTQENPKPENLDTCSDISKQSEYQQNDHLKSMDISPPTTNSKPISKSLAKMMNLSLLKDPIFILFNLATLLTSLGYYVPYFCLADLVSIIGVSSEDASHLLSIIGIVNTVGRVILGYISDRPCINRLWVYNICLIICGIATGMSLLCFDYETLIVFAIVFGFTSGAYITLTSVIITDLFGLEKLEGAYGLIFLFEGIANFLGPPIAGYLFDRTHTYTPGFLLAAFMISLSGAILFAMPSLQRWVMRRQLQQKNDNSDVAS